MSDSARGAAPIDPATPAQWQEAVNLARACVLLDSARLYGLVTGGPIVNVERCLEILRRGLLDGYVPREADVDRITLSWCDDRIRAIRTPKKGATHDGN